METFSNWTDSESLESSTWGELEYAERVIYTCLNVLENKQVKQIQIRRMLNTFLRHVARTQHTRLLHQFTLFVNHKLFNLTPHWIPRTQNDYADQLSRDHRSR